MDTNTCKALQPTPPPYVRLFNETDGPHSSSVNSSTVVVVTNEQPVHCQPPVVQSFSGHLVLSCIVFWCCGFVFGAIAFFLAVAAQSRANASNYGGREAARKLGKASVIFSVIGIVLCVIVVVLVSTLVVGGAVIACPYFVETVCYKHREMMMLKIGPIECALKGLSSNYSNGYCYWN